MTQHRDIRTQVRDHIPKSSPTIGSESPGYTVPQLQLEQKFPPELIDIIINFLPAPDQVCFALSSKYIFDCLSSWLKRKDTSLRQLLPRLILSPNFLKRSREQLLTQLENDRWEFCKCQILHPRFHPIVFGTFKKECELERSRLLCPKLFLMNLDPTFNIKIDLCPCMTITAKDKRHLYETYKTAVSMGKTHTGITYYYNGTLSHSCTGRVDQFLRHTCKQEYLQHPLGDVRARTALRYRSSYDNVDHLSVVSSLEITMTRREGHTLLLKRYYSYSARVLLWLQWFFERAGWSYNGYQTLQVIHFKVHSYWDKETKYPRSFTLDFERDFGGYRDRLWV